MIPFAGRRRGLDWTARYPRIVAAAEALPCVSAIIDGEAVVQDSVGRSDLAALHSAIDAEPHKVLLFAFDLLHLDGKDVRREPLEERKRADRTVFLSADKREV